MFELSSSVQLKLDLILPYFHLIHQYTHHPLNHQRESSLTPLKKILAKFSPSFSYCLSKIHQSHPQQLSTKPDKHNHLIRHDEELFTTNQERVDSDQENIANIANKLTDRQGNKTPLTLMQKIRDYSSIHFATPEFRYYPNILRRKDVMNQQKLKEQPTDYLLIDEKIKYLKEIRNNVESKVKELDVFHYINVFINKFFDVNKYGFGQKLKKSKVPDHQILNISFSPSIKDTLRSPQSVTYNKDRYEHSEFQNTLESVKAPKERTPIDIAIPANKVFYDENEFETFKVNEERYESAQRRQESQGKKRKGIFSR